MNIVILNGPNLNLLGEREPHIYGSTTLREIQNELYKLGENTGDSIRIFQSNHEGVLIDLVHEFRHWADGCIINPGALTHYSYSLRDALAAFTKPVVEVHISDLSKRESFRQHSVLEGLPNVSRIMGLGAEGYYQALKVLLGREVVNG